MSSLTIALPGGWGHQCGATFHLPHLPATMGASFDAAVHYKPPRGIFRGGGGAGGGAVSYWVGSAWGAPTSPAGRGFLLCWFSGVSQYIAILPLHYIIPKTLLPTNSRWAL